MMPSLLLLNSQNVLTPSILQLRFISTKGKDTNSESLISSSKEYTFRGDDYDGQPKNPFDAWRKRFLKLALGVIGSLGLFFITDPIKMTYHEIIKRNFLSVLFNETKSKPSEVDSTNSLSGFELHFELPKGNICSFH